MSGAMSPRRRRTETRERAVRRGSHGGRLSYTEEVLAVSALVLLALFDARALFDRGVERQRAGDLAGAEKFFAAASKEDSKNFAILGNLGVVRAQLGDFDGALQAYARALNLNPRAHRLRLNIAIANFKMSRFAIAAEELRQFIARVPGEPQAQELLALSLYQIGRYAESEKLLSRLIAAHGEKLPYLYALGQSQIKLGQTANAETTFGRMFSLYPVAAETSLLRAQALMAANRHEAALDVLMQAEQRGAKAPGLALWKGVALEGLGRPEDAGQAYAAEISATGDLLAFYALGILESRSGDMAKAAAMLERALPIDSERYNVSYYLSRAYTALERYEPALEYAKRSQALDPNAASEHYALMNLYRKLGRLREAKKEAEAIRALQAKSLEKDRETVKKLDSRPLP